MWKKSYVSVGCVNWNHKPCPNLWVTYAASHHSWVPGRKDWLSKHHLFQTSHWVLLENLSISNFRRVDLMSGLRKAHISPPTNTSWPVCLLHAVQLGTNFLLTPVVPASSSGLLLPALMESFPDTNFTSLSLPGLQAAIIHSFRIAFDRPYTIYYDCLC